MMREIRARGPIVSDLNVPLGFSLYRDGIFSDDHIKVLEGLLSDPDFVRKQSETERISSLKLNDY